MIRMETYVDANTTNSRSDEQYSTEVNLQDWYAAVNESETDEAARVILNGLSEEDCKSLVNRPFDIQDEKNDSYSGKLAFRSPLVLAVVTRSKDLITTLLRHGAYVHAVENVGNVVHAVCWTAYFFPEVEQELVDAYQVLLKTVASPEVNRDLLMYEDPQGLRPLELAAKLGTFLAFETLLETGDIYKVTSENKGVYQKDTYDFTEYERRGNDGRNMKSPLRFFWYLETNDLQKAGCERVLQESVIRTWIEDKLAKKKVVIFGWFIVRLLFVLLYFLYKVVDEAETIHIINTKFGLRLCPTNVLRVLGKKIIGNITGCEFIAPNLTIPHDSKLPAIRFTAMTYCGFYILLFILSGIYTVICCFIRCRGQCLHRRPRHKQTSGYVISAFYTVCQVFLCFTLALSLYTTIMWDIGWQTRSLFIDILPVIFPSWSLFYFLRLVPGIGLLIIGFQRIINTFAQFLLLGMMVFLPFAVCFYVTREAKCLDACFTHVVTSIYSTFLVTQNMDDSFTAITKTNFFPFMFLHTALIIIVNFLLMTFLIAVLSDAIQSVSHEGGSLLVLQKLDVCNAVDDALCLPYCRKYCRKYCSKKKFKYMYKLSITEISTKW